MRTAPELATVYFFVNFEGGERDSVRSAALNLAAELTDELNGHADGVDWHSESLSIWSDRPWSNEGKRLDPVYHAHVNFVAKTANFDLLGKLLDSLTEREGVTVNSVSWSLADETRLRIEREQAVAAVAEATARAQAYAAALGVANVVPVHLADTGLLGDVSAKGASADTLMARSFAGGSPEVALKPDEITVSAGVEMRFEAN